MILQIASDDRAGRLGAIARDHQGARARIRVGTGRGAGRVVAELPLVSVDWLDGERRVQILLGDPARDVWYPHEVWDIREIGVRTAPGLVEVRMEYPGGHTTLAISIGPDGRIPVPALARAVAVA